MDRGHPLAVLGLVGYMLERLIPQRFSGLGGEKRQDVDLGVFIDNIAGMPDPEHTVVLATLAEMLVDDPTLQRQCRRKLAQHADSPPKWITDLGRVTIGRAGRIAETLGDRDQLVFEVKLADGRPMTCAVAIDRLYSNTVGDFDVWSGTVGSMVAGIAEKADVYFVEMAAADVRTWIEEAFGSAIGPVFGPDRPGCRAVMRWLLAQLPEGGRGYRRPDEDWRAIEALLDTFFASPQGQPFDRFDHRELLGEMIEGGDPLRWSEPRVEKALQWLPGSYNMAPEAVLDAPDLLRAFIPVAHALVVSGMS